MVVCKSPLTGGWGDANSGGYFGSELKSAGWDAVFVTGISPAPRYLMVTDDRIELKDASHLWGRDTVETETAIQAAAGDKKIRVASIGPASEKLSLISGIVNDRGRIAARSGVGAVMGSKKLKAVAVRGTGRAAVADKKTLDRLRKNFVEEMKQMEGFVQVLRQQGTCGLTGALVASGATPIKNWQLTGADAFPGLGKITDADAIITHQSRKFACANCPVACGGIFNVTDGKLTWGNGEAMVAMVEKMIAREGFGDILADGVRRAAEKIGSAARRYAMHVGGQEPGLHNALFLPSRGTGFVCDPTPGRHTAAPMARIDGGPGAYGPYPELAIGKFDRYTYTGKGPLSATASSYLQAGASAGLCLMPLMFFGNLPLVEFFNAVTGWDFTISEMLSAGARIQALRQCFNLREGIRTPDVKLPDRMLGRPPQDRGPVAGVSIDVDSLADEYRQAMGWDPQSGRPEDETLEQLGLTGLIKLHG